MAPFASCTMGTLRNREDDEGCWGRAECWGWNPVCCRVCLLPGAVGMGELVTNGCAKVPCRVSTARNELRGQLAVCQHFSTPPLKFLGPSLFYLREKPLPSLAALCPKATSTYCPKSTFYRYISCLNPLLQVSEHDPLMKLPGLLGPHSGPQVSFPRRSGDSSLSFLFPQ